jgi:hypothetical protein
MMRLRLDRIAAILILMCAHSSDWSSLPLHEAPPTHRPTPDISLLSLRYRAETDACIVAPSAAAPAVVPIELPSLLPASTSTLLYEAPWPAGLSSAERCYLFMSLSC